MTQKQLASVLNSLSSIQDRLQKLDDKFEEREDYSFEGDFDDTLRDLISVALAALDSIYERTVGNPFLLNFKKRN